MVIAAVVAAIRLWVAWIKFLANAARPVFNFIIERQNKFIETLERISPTLANIARGLQTFVIERLKQILGFIEGIGEMIDRINPFADDPEMQMNQGDTNNAFNQVQQNKTDVTIIENRDADGNIKSVDVKTIGGTASVKTIQRGPMTRLFT